MVQWDQKLRHFHLQNTFVEANLAFITFSLCKIIFIPFSVEQLRAWVLKMASAAANIKTANKLSVRAR